MPEPGSSYLGLQDTELLLLSKGQPEAFGVLYERYAEDLLAYFACRTFDPEVAAELTAETFAEAFASRSRFTDRGMGATGWLYAIARHELARFFRRGAVQRRARKKLGMPDRTLSRDDYERIEEMIDFQPARRVIAESFSRLSEEQREAMTLRVVEGRPYPEVARALRCTEEAARARVSRGLRQLGKLLKEEPANIHAGGSAS